MHASGGNRVRACRGADVEDEDEQDSVGAGFRVVWLGSAGTRQDEAGSPGAGRAKLRLSRGFPCRPRLRRHPYWSVVQVAHDLQAIVRAGSKTTEIEREFVGGDVVRRGHAGSPGSGGASPYLRRASHSVQHILCLTMSMAAQIVIDVICGHVSRGHDREAPVGRSLTLPSRVASLWCHPLLVDQSISKSWGVRLKAGERGKARQNSAASARPSIKAPASAGGVAARWSGTRVCIGTTLRKDGVWISDLRPRASGTPASPVLARSQRGKEREDNPLSCPSKLLAHGEQFAREREIKKENKLKPVGAWHVVLALTRKKNAQTLR
jgi:hypothetical protein